MKYTLPYLLYMTKRFGVLHLAWHVHYTQIQNPVLRFFWKPVSAFFYQTGSNHSKIIDGKLAYHCLGEKQRLSKMIGGKATPIQNDGQEQKAMKLSGEAQQRKDELDQLISDKKERDSLANYLNPQLEKINGALARYPQRGKIPMVDEEKLIRFGQLVKNSAELENLVSKTSIRILYQFYSKYFQFRFLWYPDWAF